MFDSFDDALNYTGDCVIDWFHLTSLPYGLAYTSGDISRMAGYSEFVQKVLDRSKQFDKIFYLPSEILLENDLFRPSDLNLRLTIDDHLFTLLQEFDYNFKWFTTFEI